MLEEVQVIFLYLRQEGISTREMKSRLAIIVFFLAVCQFLPAIHNQQAKEQMKEIQEIASLPDIDLSSIVLQPGDLPQGYSGTKTMDRAPEAFKKLPKTKKVIDQRIKKGKEIVGGATIFLYEKGEEVERAYSAILEGFGKPRNDAVARSNFQTISNIGERATVGKFEIIIGHYLKSYHLVFIRCHAVVSILLDDLSTIFSYAQKLDQRILSSSICR